MALRPFVQFTAKVPAAAFRAARRVLDEDPMFRARVATVATEELVGQAGSLYVRRPEGWEATFRDVVIDAMAWTRHVAALGDPLQDMRLNLASHLTLLQAIRAQPARLLVYLGSRSQYGRMSSGVITEDTPMTPQDPQGVHKVAAESHFKNFSSLDGFNVVSLRLPNCFGESQPVAGEDIGLVGGFIRSFCLGETVKVYGEGRRRSILYARDAADIVAAVVERPVAGFVPLNVTGHDVDIRELAQRLQSLVGSGAVATEEMPAHIKAMDTGDAVIDAGRLQALIGKSARTEFSVALDATVRYFKERLQ